MSSVIKLASYLVPMATAFVPGEGSCTSDLREEGVEDAQGPDFVSPDGSACNLEQRRGWGSLARKSSPCGELQANEKLSVRKGKKEMGITTRFSR
jgi:hypothetical protein